MTTSGPVIIIGAARTGTTWLSNLLIHNFGYCSMVSALHHGVKEPQLFYLNRYYNRLANPALFKEQMKFSDIFNLLGVEEHTEIQQPSYFDFFFDHMDKMALQEGKPWFIKLCPEFLYAAADFKTITSYLIQRYPTIQYIVIQRNEDDYMKSYLSMPGKNKQKRGKWYTRLVALFLGMARYRVLYEQAGKFPNALQITYEELLTAQTGALDKIKTVLGREYTSGSSIVPNSSDKDYHFPQLASHVVKWLTQSKAVCVTLLTLYRWFTRNTPPDIYTRIYDRQFNPGKLKAHLEARGEMNLLKQIEKENV